MEIEDILSQVRQHNTVYVTVTGGEPLAQKDCLTLLQKLCDEDYEVSLETSGAIDISEVDPRVIKVMDLKTPRSGEMTKNIWQNLEFIQPRDQIKFVLCGRQDYDWARMKIQEYKLDSLCEILMSPSFEELEPTDLANWILQDQLRVRMQIQLHKILWGNKRGV